MNNLGRMQNFLVAFVVAGFVATSFGGLRAQDSQPRDGRFFESQARKAYEAKDYPSFLDNMKHAVELRPNHPRLMYNLAIAFALNGNKSEAISWLRRTAEMGLVLPAKDDHDFDSLKSMAEFQSVLQKFEENQTPKISSLQAFTVHEKGLVPESVAYDPANKTFYLSSVYKRKILRIDAKGAVSLFADERSGLWSVMGMKIDSARRLLWVCTTAHPQMSNYRKEENGSSALFKYDLRTGKLLAKYFPSDKTKPHWLGDLAINSRGDVFTTDSISPAVYVLRQGQEQLETLFEGAPFVSPQGLDFTTEQTKLFVSDYSKGIFVIDLKTRQITELVSDFTLLGIDGLYFYRGSLIGVQNGVNPQRLIRLSVRKDLSRIDGYQIIEANNPVFDEPTLGVLVKDSFYFVANSQWGAIDKNGQLAPEDKLKDPLILKVKL